jgi:hypothetical protein
MTVTAITTRKNPELPERGALRAAIARVAEVRQEASAIEGAIEVATHLVMECRSKLEVASKAVTAAKAEDAERLAAALVSGVSAPPQVTRRAREAEIAATDALEAARSAVGRLEADLKHVDHEVERSIQDVDVAIGAVLAPTAKVMVEQAKGFRAEFLQRQYAMNALHGLDGFTSLHFAISESEHRELCASVQRSWQAAIAALKTNADAPLPSIDDSSRKP